MILACQNIEKSFAAEPVLTGVSMHLENGEKAALTGVNGCGKSTLMKIIAGEESADAGVVTIAKDTSIGYLAQIQELTGEETIYGTLRAAKASVFRMEDQLRSLELSMKHASGEELDRLMESYTQLTHSFELANGYAARSEIEGVFRGLGFSDEDRDRSLSTLSGGQKTRVALGRMLLEAPDLLLLDEPTNHLDMDSVAWLESYLSGFSGAVLVVSHDRYFLDRVVTKVIEIEHGTALSYEGNYTEFSEKKSRQRKAELLAYEKQQDEIRHQEEVIKKLKQFNREKSIRRAESREKMMSHIDRIEKPVEQASEMRLTLKPRVESGKDVLTVSNVSKAFGLNTLFENQSFLIRKGERVAIIGKNGTGKTTLLKMIDGLEPIDAGTITPGSKVQIGYFDQEHQQLSMDHTIFEELQDAYPTLNNTEIRNVLAAFLFTGEDVFQPIQTLSGGEQGRVSLAKLMLSESNLLLLDEPTNHLDAQSREILEDALRGYTGTVLYVSHDRYFINRTATRILELDGGNFVNYIGNYDYYLEKKAERLAKEEEKLPKEAVYSEAKLDWQTQKALEAEKRKHENALRATEEEISRLEEEIRAIDAEFELPETGLDVARCQELAKKRKEAETALSGLYEKWEELAEG
jgi:ATP-binding cassette subfamily F protein 3